MTKISEAIASGNYVDGKLCVDCYFAEFAENENPGPSWDSAKSGSVRAEFFISQGHIAEEEHPGSECDEDRECAQGFYNSYPCSACASTLGGDRFDVIMISKSDL